MLQQIYLEVLQEVDSRALVAQTLQAETPETPTDVLAIGKAAVPMALAAQEALGENLGRGFLLTKDHHLPESREELQAFSCWEAAHPVPNQAGVEATEALLAWLASPSDSENALVLISGGASSLLVAPRPPLQLRDLEELNTQLLRSGMPIEEINVLRKHLSRVKGGQLAEHFRSHSQLKQLVMVDICAPGLSNEEVLSLVGSGPCVGDPSTKERALEQLQQLKGSLKGDLYEKTCQALAETPHETRFESRLVADYKTLTEKARLRLGSDVLNVPGWEPAIQGNVRAVAKRFADFAQRLQSEGAKGVLVASGEPTVILECEQPGRGGRCQELALHFAREVAGRPGLSLLAGSSDGTDGPTDDAGALVTGETWDTLAQKLGQEALLEALEKHDSGTVLAQLPGALLTTGPTGQNLNDLFLLKIS